MKKLVLVCLLAAGALVASAQAPQNWIYQHNLAYQDPNDPNLPNTYYYDVDQQNHTVVIHQSIYGEEFWFDAALLDGNGQYTDPGNIHSIAADADAGTISVKIVGSGHEYGADAVDAISLGSIEGTHCTISGLATYGDIGADRPIYVDSASGTWTVGQNYPGVPGYGSILSDVYAGCFVANLYCYKLTNLYVGDDCGTECETMPPPVVQIWNDLAGTVESKMTNILFDALSVAGTLTGIIDIYGNIGMVGCGFMDSPANVHLRGNVSIVITARGPVAESEFTVDGSVTVTMWLGVYPDPLDGISQVHVFGNCEALETWTPLSGTIKIDGSLSESALKAGGTGHFDVGGTLGYLRVGGDNVAPVGWAGTLYAGTLGSFLVAYGDLSGGVNVDTDFDGTVQVGSSTASHNLTATLEFAHEFRGPGIEIWGNLGSASKPGQIKIDGSFGNGASLSWIYAHGSMVNAKSFVTVDYDGYDASDRWGLYGRVRVGNSIYTQNTPAMHIYETTLCKADMDNNHIVNASDLVPLKLAVEHPAEYADKNPGLAGSMLYHGDLDCDGDVDLDDSNLFANFIGYCTSTCAGAGRMAAQTLAAGILVTVPDEDLPDVVDLVVETKDSRDDPQDWDYWHAVSTELGQ